MALAEQAKREKGEVVVRDWKRGRGFAIRFRAYGERRYLTLGSETEGWSHKRAEEEVENILADVRRGIWVAPKRRRSKETSRSDEDAPPDTPFGPFADGLVKKRKGEVSERQTEYDEWALGHLMPFFADWLLSEIDAEAIDEFRRSKLAESARRQKAISRRRPLLTERGQPLKPFEPSTINKMIEVLHWVLEIACEYHLIEENEAAGKKRKLKVPPKPPRHLDSVHQIDALIEAAAIADRDHTLKLRDRRAVVSAFILAGPRAIEAGHLLWRDVDLANGRLFVGRSKTQAGLREVRLLPVLRDELAAHKARAAKSGPNDLVFPNHAGNRRGKDAFRKLMLPIFRLANKILEERGHRPLPNGISPHKLRHTFASVLIACGEDPASVMEQLGHTDPHFTMRVYTHMMSRDEAERSRLKALVKGERVIAIAAPEPEPLDGAVYERAILEAVAGLGGSGSRAEVIEAVGAALAAVHGPADLEVLPSGRDVRWVQRLAKARMKLIARRQMKETSARGRWELTAEGIRRGAPPGSTMDAETAELGREAVAA